MLYFSFTTKTKLHWAFITFRVKTRTSILVSNSNFFLTIIYNIFACGSNLKFPAQSCHVLTLDRLLTRTIHDFFKMAFFKVKLSKFEQKLSHKLKTTLTLRDTWKDNLVSGLSRLIGQAHLKGNPLIRV